MSIAANIAEGAVRSSDPDFARFLHIAIGSASEGDYYLLLCRDLRHLDTPDYETMDSAIQELKRMLNALITRLKAKS